MVGEVGEAILEGGDQDPFQGSVDLRGPVLQGGGEVTECRAPLIGHGGQLRHAADSVVLGAVGDQGDHLFLWLGIQRIEEDDMSGPQTRLQGLPSRRLQSHAKAVHSAAGLPPKLVPELDSGQHPEQD